MFEIILNVCCSNMFLRAVCFDIIYRNGFRRYSGIGEWPGFDNLRKFITRNLFNLYRITGVA